MCSGMNVMFRLDNFVKTSVFNSAASELLLIMEDVQDSFGSETPSGGFLPLTADLEKRLVAVTAVVENGERIVRNVARAEADAIVSDAGKFVISTVRAHLATAVVFHATHSMFL